MRETRIAEEILVEAREEQLRLASHVSRSDSPFASSRYIIGVDVSYMKTQAFTCAVVLDSESLQVVQTERRTSKCDVPYISGFFYLREAPLILDILKRIEYQGPVLIDGNGILHPRRMGLASYVGVKMNIPTIGIAKGLLCGKVGQREGDSALITEGSEILAAAVWLGKRKHPVYVSTGHKVSLPTCIEIVRRSSKYGNPESLRKAHLCAKQIRGLKENPF